MLRTVRSFRQLRRILAVAIALAFSARTIEAMVPDVHDGDAAGRAWTSVGSSLTGGESPSALACRTASESDGRRGSAVDAVVASSPRCEGDGREHGATPPAHAFHLEHCGHEHTATPAAVPRLEVNEHWAGTTPITRVAMLRSVRSAPALRPPIA
ncbi:MAG: hypothetical protein ABI601_02985 [bacterium]